jgi:polysaccharide export outer membrane protein
MFLSFKNNKIANLNQPMSDLQRNLPAVTITPAGTELKNSSPTHPANIKGLLGKLALLIAALAIVAGCQTKHSGHDGAQVSEVTSTNIGSTNSVGTNSPEHSETIVLREGDGLRITFPTAANLNATTTIRRDGNISLTLIGDVKAAGKTLKELKADLLTLYKDQTDSREMTLELVSSLFPVFVTGAVLQPHKVMSDHPITALETIMECGGFDYSKANLKNVTVLRWEGSHLQTYHLDLKSVMKGKNGERFYMQPGDVIYVREIFTWF